MKKIIFLILSLVLAVSIVGCNTVTSTDVTDTVGVTDTTTDSINLESSEEESDFDETTESVQHDVPPKEMSYKDYINYRASLKNTYEKLTKDKELTVVYFGGSITGGYGSTDADNYSWRALIGKWLQAEFPDATVNNVNRAIGESGTYLGVNRVQMDVISAKPDLLFIEYSINDYYYKSTYEQAASQYETIIREVKKALPDTDIVTVLVTDKNCLETNRQGLLHTQAQAHEDIAKVYNIPTIHVGRYIASVVDYSADKWSNYAIDIVHLNNSGYELYYNVIREFMYNTLVATNFSEPQEKFVMSPVISDALFDGDRKVIVPTAALLTRSEALGGRNVTWLDESVFSSAVVSEARGRFHFKNLYDILIIEFSGTEMSAYVFKNNITWWVSVDGGDYVEVSSNTHNPTVFAKDLSSGKHTLKIKLKAGDNVDVGAMFTRDATKATPKGTK